jgi:hypothetical membrane protein
MVSQEAIMKSQTIQTLKILQRLELKMKNFRMSLFLCSILVLLSYSICTLLAFFNYRLPYSPVKNWLSDLGSKVLNPNGAIIYNIGIVLTALFLIFFFLGFSVLKSTENRIRNLMIILTQSCGILGCLSMALSAVYSIDTPGPHSFFSAGMRISIGTAFAFSVAALRYDPKVPKWLLGLGVLTTLTNFLVSVFANSTQVFEWPTILLFLLYVVSVGGTMKSLEKNPGD